MPLDVIRKRARRFQSQIMIRNLIEYGAGLVVVPSFVGWGLSADDPIVSAGAFMIAIGALVALWQLYRRGGARRPPEASAASLADFHRLELTRQRDALASVATWYLGPFAPGLIVVLVGRWLSPAPGPGRSVQMDQALTVMMAIIMLLLFLVVFLANRLAAHGLQKQIDDLE